MTDRIGVVVVSADAGTRSHVRLTLGDARFHVRDGEDVVATMQLVATELPALVIVDVDLGEATALGIARSLRGQPETSSIRTLLLLPRGTNAPHLADGVDATLQVPATAFALLKKVDGLLGA